MRSQAAGGGVFERLERLERLELYREGYRPSMKPLSSNFLHRLMSTIIFRFQLRRFEIQAVLN